MTRMNSFSVYKHTTPNGKVYIGITSLPPKKRWKNGRGYDLCTAFSRAIVKYGWANIEHEVLFHGLSKEEACAKEIELIEKYDSANPEHGYNLTHGGEHYEPNEEWRAKLSESNKRYYENHPEARERISERQKGKRQSETSNKKRGETMRRYFADHPEQRYERGKSFRGKKRGAEFSKALGERKSKKVICVETGETYPSIIAASEAIGASRTGITNMLTGRAKTCKGYTFAYADGNASEG